MGDSYRPDNDVAQGAFGLSLAFLGLLFAVLASGCQSSDIPGKERELTSQVYGMLNTCILIVLDNVCIISGWLCLGYKQYAALTNAYE